MVIGFEVSECNVATDLCVANVIETGVVGDLGETVLAGFNLRVVRSNTKAGKAKGHGKSLKHVDTGDWQALKQSKGSVEAGRTRANDGDIEGLSGRSSRVGSSYPMAH